MESKDLIEPPKIKFQDKLPDLLENNIFDQAITGFRGLMDIFHVKEALENVVYWNTWSFLRLAFKLLFKWRVYGQNNFPEYGPVLLVSNHQSVLDPFLIAAGVQREIRWMSKIQNFNMPIFKSILSFYGTFSVNREDKPTVVLDKAVSLLRSGECVGMFPEGTRSEDGSLAQNFKTGAARILLRAGVPYVPACILGSHNVLPKNSLNLKLKKVEIRVGEPVYLDPSIKLSDQDEILKITAEMRKKIDYLMRGEIDPVKKIIITPDQPDAIRKDKAKKLDLSIS